MATRYTTGESKDQAKSLCQETFESPPPQTQMKTLPKRGVSSSVLLTAPSEAEEPSVLNRFSVTQEALLNAFAVKRAAEKDAQALAENVVAIREMVKSALLAGNTALAKAHELTLSELKTAGAKAMGINRELGAVVKTAVKDFEEAKVELAIQKSLAEPPKKVSYKEWSGKVALSNAKSSRSEFLHVLHLRACKCYRCKMKCICHDPCLYCKGASSPKKGTHHAVCQCVECKPRCLCWDMCVCKDPDSVKANVLVANEERIAASADAELAAESAALAAAIDESAAESAALAAAIAESIESAALAMKAAPQTNMICREPYVLPYHSGDSYRYFVPLPRIDPSDPGSVKDRDRRIRKGIQGHHKMHMLPVFKQIKEHSHCKHCVCERCCYRRTPDNCPTIVARGECRTCTRVQQRSDAMKQIELLRKTAAEHEEGCKCCACVNRCICNDLCEFCDKEEFIKNPPRTDDHVESCKCSLCTHLCSCYYSCNGDTCKDPWKVLL